MSFKSPSLTCIQGWLWVFTGKLKACVLVMTLFRMLLALEEGASEVRRQSNNMWFSFPTECQCHFLNQVWVISETCCVAAHFPGSLYQSNDCCFILSLPISLWSAFVDCGVRGNGVSPWKLRLSNDNDKVMLIFERPSVNLQNCERHTIKSSLPNASNPTCACLQF